MEKVGQLRYILILWVFSACTFNLWGQTNGLEVQLTPMVSLENFSWSIAGNLNGTDPNILSELKWEKLINAGLDVELRYRVSNRFQLRASQILATTLNGRVSDIDYAEDNRQNPVFSTTENAKKGYDVQSNGGIAYDVPLGRSLYLTPYLGLVYSKRYLSITNTSNGLDSSYRPYTYGPMFGLSIRKVFTDYWEVAFEIRTSATKYRASGDWNLIEELRHPVSFRHRANMYSLNGQLSFLKRFGKSSLAVFFFYEHAATDKGIDTLFFEDGTLAYTQLNGVLNQTFRLGLSYRRYIW